MALYLNPAPANPDFMKMAILKATPIPRVA